MILVAGLTWGSWETLDKVIHWILQWIHSRIQCIGNLLSTFWPSQVLKYLPEQTDLECEIIIY